MLITISLVLIIGNLYPKIIANPRNIIYVDDSGGAEYTNIQEAIDNSIVGDTIYVYSGTYLENIIINKSINLTGEDKNTTIIDGSSNGNVISLFASYVNVTGFTIRNSGGYDTNGLIIIDKNHSRIFGNTFTNNFFGINIQETAVDNLIFHNNLMLNIFNAMDSSNNENLWDNGLEGNFWDDYAGTDLNGDGIGDEPYTLIGQFNCKDKYPLIHPWQISKKTIYVDDNYSNSTPGWQVDHFNSIQDAIDITKAGDTVYVYHGIYYENLFIDKPIDIEGENRNTTIIDGGGNGDVVEVYSYNLRISGFTIKNSGGPITRGLILWDTGYNEITDNIFTNNYMGINLKGNSFENIVHHNFFINNTYNAFDYTERENQWDDGSEGNYWDDYTGNGSYTIQGPYGCQDRYPLIIQSGPNNPPNTPYNPTPSDGKTSVNINQDLYWNANDPDGDPITYDVYIGTTSSPIKISYNQSANIFNPGTMNYNTKYYWKIVSWDNHGASSIGPVWSFTIGAQSQGGGGGGGGDGGPILYPNKIPVANASASSNSGLVNTPITFNGLYSFDEDGNIVNYTWDFDDGSTGYGIITTHIYLKAGVYDVKLTVTDNNGVDDTNSFNVIISQPSNPPTIPQIDGPNTGKKNIEYSFIVSSTDPGNDAIQYVFNWGDGQTNETDFRANGTTYVQKHKWTTAGIFKIEVFAIDDKYTASPSAGLNILIDVIYCNDIGYLIDENSDGTYDLFYSNKTSTKTTTEKQGTSSYLLNYDEDSDWDYVYDTQNNAISSYIEPSAEITNGIFNWLIVLVIVVILLVLIVVIINRKKRVEKPEGLKTEELQVEESKIEEQKIQEQKIEELKTEDLGVKQPASEVSKIEEPKIEEPKTVEQKVEELITAKAMVEEPKEEPKVEEKKTEEPVVKESEELKTEVSKVEELKIEEAEIEEQKAEEKKIEEQKLGEIETKEPEIKESEELKTEESRLEEKETEEQKKEELKPEKTEIKEPEIKEFKPEESKVEEQVTVEQKAEEKKIEEPKTEEIKPEESKVEEPKIKESNIEETKNEKPEVKKPKSNESDNEESKT